MIIGIIGGGASGMAAALAAAQNPDVQVLLFERQARLGRKLQATGNGRCNLSNIHASERGYHGQSPDFIVPALSRFDPEETLRWFHELGLFTVCEPSGRVYPYSDQANSVLDVLRFALEKPNIRVITGFEVAKAKRSGDGFTVLEVLKQVENIVGFNMDYSFGPQREGDASVIITNNEKAKEILSYEVTKTIKDMVESQYMFQSQSQEKELLI